MRKGLLAIGLAIVLLGIVCVMPREPGAGAAKPMDPEFRAALINVVDVARKEGSLMEFSPENHNAQVATAFWRGLTYEAKKQFLFAVAVAMEAQNGQRFVRLRDGFSGKLVGTCSESSVTVEP